MKREELIITKASIGEAGLRRIIDAVHYATDRFTVATTIGWLSLGGHTRIVIKIAIDETVAIFTPAELRSAGKLIVEKLPVAEELGMSDADAAALRALAEVFIEAADDADREGPHGLLH